MIACKYCIAKHGLRGFDLPNLPKTEAEMFDHIERVHHIVVARKGETKAASIARFIAAYPEVKECQECRDAGAPWAQE